MTKTRIAWVVTFFIFGQSTAFADEVLDRAKQLIQQKNPAAAYELLSPLEAARAGDVEFDYLIGIAALDSGDAQQAVFALERVLAVNPNHLQARAEIAKAYLILGERENARREFTSVRNQNPPEAVKETIDRFLSAMDVSPTRLSGFAEIGVGIDSNVNNATSSNQIAIPAFGGGMATLGAAGVQQGDTFMSLAGGVNLAHGLTPEWTLLGSLGANWKLNSDNSQFDNNSVDGSAGARWARDKDAVTVGYQAQAFRVDNARFRDSNGLIAQWQHNYNETRQVTGYVQYTDISYPAQAVRDAQRTIFGVAGAQALGGPFNTVLFGSLYTGEEREKADGVAHLGHKPLGIRLGGQMTLNEQTTLFANTSLEERRYGGQEPLFLIARNDSQFDLRVGASYVPVKGWLLTPQISYTENRSNVSLYRYNRLVTSLTLRREF